MNCSAVLGGHPYVSGAAPLPRPLRAGDCPGQDRVLNVLDPPQPARRGAAPLEAGFARRPVKQGDAPGGLGPCALVIDEAMIGRAPRRGQPAARPPWAARRGVGSLKSGVGLREIERRTAKQLLKCVPDAERQSSDGGHRPEALALQVGPQCSRYRQRGRIMVAGDHTQPQGCGGAENQGVGLAQRGPERSGHSSIDQARIRGSEPRRPCPCARCPPPRPGGAQSPSGERLLHAGSRRSSRRPAESARAR